MGGAKGRVVAPGQIKGLANLNVTAVAVPTSGNLKDKQSIGSSLTDASGNFLITWESQVIGQTSFGLIISVEGALRPGQEPVVLFESAPVITSTNALTTHFIEITDQVISDTDSDALPPTNADIAVQTIQAAAAQAEIVEREWEAVARQRVARKRSMRTTFVENFKPRLLRELSIQPDELINNDQIVIEGHPQRTVERVTNRTLMRGAEQLSNSNKTSEGRQRIARYFLNEDQRAKLQELLQELPANSQVLNQEQLEQVLLHGEDLESEGKPFELGGEAAQFEKFVQMTFDESCAKEILSDSLPEPTETDTDESDVIPLTDEELDRQLAKVTADVDSPIGALRSRPGQEDVIGSIRDFALSPGPADAPAFYDFHQLNIAFDHVWKEFLDGRIEPLAERAFMSVVERGGAPSLDESEGTSAIKLLESEAALVDSASINPVPRAAFAQRVNLPGGIDGVGSIQAGEFDPEFPLPPFEPPIGQTTPPIGGIEKPQQFPTEEHMPSSSLLQKLKNILRGKYSFTAFGADAKSHAINFGLAVTYRQRWEPVAYQVGELNHTVTLAPGESRKYTSRTNITRKRAEKEIEKNSSILKDNFYSKTRAESEIVRKAHAKTNFNIATDGSYNFGIASGDSTVTSNHDATNASDSAKKSFREAIIKSSQEYRQERNLEVSSEDNYEFEETESGEIKNPNDELTVTYLFYELQRRFRVNEQIFKATPVLLVAQDIPKPNHIDESFLIRHGWILKRALLDDMYIETFAYVAGPMAGDKVAKDALYTAMNNHRVVVAQLKDDLYAMKEQASEGYEALRRAVNARISETIEEDTDGFFSDVNDFFGGGGQSTEGAQAREEAARAHEQRAVEQVKQQTMALQREVSAYSEATQKYTQALRKYTEWELRIIDLLVHMKENIVHYMQAIWAYEHPDERYMRMQYKKAPAFEEIDDGAAYRFVGDTEITRETLHGDGSIELRKAVEFEFQPNFSVNQGAKTLNEIADLNTLIGFKGNYMIFPLRESNPLTDFMLAPYVDAGFRLLDPHDPGNINREQFARYICYLREQLDDDAFETIRPELQQRFQQLLLSEPNQGDEIVVPSGSLYIEALPGSNPLIEDFKLAHRALDVVETQESARKITLDNIRRAAMLLADDYSDPDIDAKYLFEKGVENSAVVIAPNPRDGDEA